MELWKFVFNFVAVGSVSSSGLVFIGCEVFFLHSCCKFVVVFNVYFDLI